MSLNMNKIKEPRLWQHKVTPMRNREDKDAENVNGQHFTIIKVED